MLRTVTIAAAALLVGVGATWAQGNTTSAAAPFSNPVAQVLGPTGTMYDGNNAELRLPPDPNAWFAQKWSGYVPLQPTPNAPTAATGPGVSGASLGSKQTGGEH